MANVKDKYDYMTAINLPGHGDNNIPFTLYNTLNYILFEFDKLYSLCNNVDVVGYSLGGVIALYLAQVRKINKLILLAPALKYLNLKNYKLKVKKNNLTLRTITPKNDNKRYLLTFVSLVHYIKNNLDIIYSDTLIIWGREDYLVKEASGHHIYNLCMNKKSYIILDNINHFNIVRSELSLKYILDFIK